VSELPTLALATGTDPAAAVAVAENAQRFRVGGMDCASCARTVEKAVAALDGASAARVSFGNALLVVEGPVEAERVERAVAAAGYRARPAALRRVEPRGPFWRSGPQALSTILATLVLLFARPRSRWLGRREWWPSPCTWFRWRSAAGSSRVPRWWRCTAARWT
jgi:copper chaperone CopZ